MATPIRQLRGTASELALYTGAAGVIATNDTTNDIHVHDGVTPGGHGLLARAKAYADTILPILDITALNINGTWTAHGPDGIPAKTGLEIEAQADSPTMPEIGVNVTLFNDVEPTIDPSLVYKIGLGGYVKSTATHAHLYGGNTIVDGKAGPGYGFLTGFEANINNRGAHADTLGTVTSACGIVAAPGGGFRSTAGFWAPASFPGSEWNYSFAASGFTIKAGFYDETNAAAAFASKGAHTYGMDLRDSILGISLATPNNVPIQQETLGGTLLTIANLATDNIMDLGSPLMGYIRSNQSFVPLTDNAYQLGIGDKRWSNVFSSNGTIQTSDPALKTDMAPLPDVMPLIDAIDPITFRWKEGGNEVEEVEEDGEVQATETFTVIRTRLVDGVYREVEETEERQLFDERPVTGLDGQPAMTWVKGSPEIRDPKTGQVVREAVPATQAPKVQWVPRMVPGKIKKAVTTAVAGKRTHWGFNAENVRDAFAAAGMDFGGYVETADGTKALRPDQLIPVLWQAVKELKAQIDDLKDKASGA